MAQEQTPTGPFYFNSYPRSLRYAADISREATATEGGIMPRKPHVLIGIAIKYANFSPNQIYCK